MHILKTLIVLSVAVVSHIVVIAQIPTNGLIAHWPFNGNANDVSGNNHHPSTISNVTPATGRLGQPNTAYRFHSVNSFISIPHHNDWNTNNLTICAIIKPDTFYSGDCQGNYIITRGSINTGHSGSFTLAYTDNAYNDCFTSDTNNYVFVGAFGSIPSPDHLWVSPQKVHSGVWYCVVATYDGTTCKLYVDGTLVATVVGWAPSLGSSTDSVCIGKYPAGGLTHPYNFKGSVDDIALYNRALTAAEVAQYCNAATVLVSLNQPLSKTSLCPGDTMNIGYQVTNSFNTGNIFTVQLSDATGNFTTPVTIGSIASTTSGNILCTIPANTPAGSGYRVRIVSSAPVYTSPDNGVNLTVNPAPPKPQVTIIPNPGTLLSPWQTVTFTATVTNGGSAPKYQWLRNGQPVPGATTNPWSTYNLSNNDKISAVVYSNDTCSGPNTDTSEQLLINIKTGITNTDNSSGISIYPNPNNGKFTIAKLPLGDIALEIVNSIGQVAYCEQLKSNQKEHTISADMPPGVYILNLISEDARRSAIFSVY